MTERSSTQPDGGLDFHPSPALLAELAGRGEQVAEVSTGDVNNDTPTPGPINSKKSTPSRHRQRVEPNCLTRPMRVLIVDDYAPLRALLKRFLEIAGAQIQEAGDGKEAISLVLEHNRCGRSFDAVLLDMRMPLLDGRACATAIRATGYAGTIVALTAEEGEFDRESCLAAGCDAHASKPIQPQALVDLLRHTHTP